MITFARDGFFLLLYQVLRAMTVRKALYAAITILLLSFSVSFMMRAVEARYMFTDASQIPQTEVGIVLGASIVQGRPSPILGKRADAAIQLYKAGKISKILVTGDDGKPGYDEVTPVRTYLIGAGIPSESIMLDRAGFDTYSSMHRARHVFQVTSATVITQEFHLPRALFIARSLGINAYGFVASGGEGFTREYFREVPASIKAIFDLAMRRQPQ